jgi:glycosyltransferase involved in cell wall biosynthesis
MINIPRVCQVVASINENTGGSAYAIANLAQAVSKHQVSSNIFTLDYQNKGQQINALEVTVYHQLATKVARYFRGFQPSASQYLSDLAKNKFDIIHNHGLWMFPNVYARQAAVKHRLPLVISPIGMLESWSLKYSWYKKILAWYLYEKINLDSAAVFQATSVEEIKSIRKIGYQQPIALIPNGVDIPSLANLPSKQILIDLFPSLANCKWLLFLSRIHPKKGLDNLLYVWSKIVKQFPDWHLIIAGPDAIGYQATLERLVTELYLNYQVTFTGMLSGEKKTSALTNADLFVLPTHSENFGIAIAESLAYGVPVITTQEAPWEDLLTYDCGWWIEDNQLALKTALIEAMKLSDSQRQTMGRKGRTMVQNKYSWDFVGKQMAEVYHWILRGGTTPNCIHLD